MFLFIPRLQPRRYKKAKIRARMMFSYRKCHQSLVYCTREPCDAPLGESVSCSARKTTHCWILDNPLSYPSLASSSRSWLLQEAERVHVHTYGRTNTALGLARTNIGLPVLVSERGRVYIKPVDVIAVRYCRPTDCASKSLYLTTMSSGSTSQARYFLKGYSSCLTQNVL